MKKLLAVFFVMIFFPGLASGSGLITGSVKHKFEPGDKVLFKTDFSQCPVGEAPTEFDKIEGIPECVEYGNKIWVAANGASTLRLYKKADLGRGDFSIEFSFFTYGDGGKVELVLFKNSPKGWNSEKINKKVVFDYCCSRYLTANLEGGGQILNIDHTGKKKFRVAIQVRRGQFRVFFNGKRLAAVPFNLPEGEKVSGFALIRHGDHSYNLLLTDIRVAKYSKKEPKPTPEKLGITVNQTSEGLKLTVPEKVLFDFNKFILKPGAKDALGVVADVIRRSPVKKVVVTGFTDNIGSDEYNMKLSLQRAQSVADYLMYCEKINPELFEIVGKGKANPVADNTTEAGRAKNRRVEIQIIKK